MRKALVVDDVAMNRALLVDILSEDYNIIEASNGVQALNLIRENADDLSVVMLDLVMPEMDGFGVLKAMGEEGWIDRIQLSYYEAASAEVESEITVSSTMLARMRSMQKAVDDAFEKANGNPTPIPEYNNRNNIITELHTILGNNALSYNIDFTEEQIEDCVVRREVPITFTARDYDTAMYIVKSIYNSPNKYLMETLSITDNTKDDGEGFYTVSMNLICFEYKN